MRSRARNAARDTFRSLRVRNFRLFFGGQLVSQTGTWLSMLAQTLLVLRLTRSGVAVGLLTASHFLPILLLGAWAGTVADRSDKRRLLLWLQAGSMLQSFALAAMVFAGATSLGAIYVLALVQGVLTALDNPARRAFVVEMVDQGDMANAVSLNSAVMTGSRIVGPAAAGALVVTVGFGWAFLIDAVSYSAVLVGLWRMRPAELYPAARTRRGPGQVREGLRYIRGNPDLLVPVVMMAIVGTLAFNFQVTIPLLVTGPLGAGVGTFTVLFSVISVGSLLGALATARRTEVTVRHIVVASAGFGASMLALAASPVLGVAFPVGVLLGVTSIAFMTSSTAVLQALAAPEYRGRVLAIQSMVFLGSTPIGGPLVGWISDTAGPRAGVAVGGLACLAAAAYGARALRRPAEVAVVGPAGLDDEAVTLAD